MKYKLYVINLLFVVGFSISTCGGKNIVVEQEVSKSKNTKIEEPVYFPLSVNIRYSGNEVVDINTTLTIGKIENHNNVNIWSEKLYEVVDGPRLYYDTCRGREDCLTAAPLKDPFIGQPVQNVTATKYFTGYGTYQFTVKYGQSKLRDSVEIIIDEKTEIIKVNLVIPDVQDENSSERMNRFFIVSSIQKSNGDVKLKPYPSLKNEFCDKYLGYEIFNNGDRKIFGTFSGILNYFTMDVNEKRGDSWYTLAFHRYDCYEYGNQLGPGKSVKGTPCFETDVLEQIENSKYDCFRVVMDYNYNEEPDSVPENGRAVYGVRRYRAVDYIEKYHGACQQSSVHI